MTTGPGGADPRGAQAVESTTECTSESRSESASESRSESASESTSTDASARGLRPVPADLLRLAALVSVGVGAWLEGAVGLALFLLVLGGSVLPRALGSPPALDVAFCLAILFGAWAAQLDWYVTVPWLDVVVHAIANGLVATMAFGVLTRLGVLPATLSWPAVVVVVSCLGGTLALLWELGEWFGHTVVDDRIQVGYDDTVGDLAMGLVGSVAAALLLGRRAGGGAAR